MNINKALRKQKKSYRRFMLSMSFIFVTYPIIVYVTKSFEWYSLTLLVTIEILIIITMISKVKSLALKYIDTKDKIKITTYFPKRSVSISYDNIVGVHFDFIDDEPRLYIITTAKLRGKQWKKIHINKVDKSFQIISRKIIAAKDTKNLYYCTITKGKYLKYKVLDILYSRAFYAVFSQEAINEIKNIRDDVSKIIASMK